MEPNLEALLQRARAGEAEARDVLLTLLHSEGAPRAALLQRLHPETGRAHRVGLAGPVGVGKSTLLAHLARGWRDEGRTVGLVTAESAGSKGEALGERLRLHELGREEGILHHALPAALPPSSRNLSAGLVADALEALGADPILLEAPGLGVGEVELIRRSHSLVLVLIPDDLLLQAVQEGPWLDGADLVVLNHADREGSEAKAQLLRTRLDAAGRNQVPVVSTVGRSGEGVDRLARALAEHLETLRRDGAFEMRRRSGLRAQLQGLAEVALLESLWEEEPVRRALEAELDAVVQGDRDPATAARALVQRLRGA